MNLKNLMINQGKIKGNFSLFFPQDLFRLLVHLLYRFFGFIAFFYRELLWFISYFFSIIKRSLRAFASQLFYQCFSIKRRFFCRNTGFWVFKLAIKHFSSQNIASSLWLLPFFNNFFNKITVF